jgi:hypothetical protein
LPVIFGYLVAGMLVGPHVPTPFGADEAMIRALAELGVVLLMYSLGLEFRVGRVIEIGGAAGLGSTGGDGADVRPRARRRQPARLDGDRAALRRRGGRDLVDHR